MTPDLGDPKDGNFIISICLIADIFGKDRITVYEDVEVQRRIVDKRRRREEDKLLEALTRK